MIEELKSCINQNSQAMTEPGSGWRLNFAIVSLVYGLLQTAVILVLLATRHLHFPMNTPARSHSVMAVMAVAVMFTFPIAELIGPCPCFFFLLYNQTSLTWGTLATFYGYNYCRQAELQNYAAHPAMGDDRSSQHAASTEELLKRKHLTTWSHKLKLLCGFVVCVVIVTIVVSVFASRYHPNQTTDRCARYDSTTLNAYTIPVFLLIGFGIWIAVRANRVLHRDAFGLRYEFAVGVICVLIIDAPGTILVQYDLNFNNGSYLDSFDYYSYTIYYRCLTAQYTFVIWPMLRTFEPVQKWVRGLPCLRTQRHVRRTKRSAIREDPLGIISVPMGFKIFMRYLTQEFCSGECACVCVYMCERESV